MLQTFNENEQTSLYKTWVQSRSIFNSQMHDETKKLQALAAPSQSSGKAEGDQHYRDLAKATPTKLLVSSPGFLHLWVLQLEKCDTVICLLRINCPSDLVS